MSSPRKRVEAARAALDNAQRELAEALLAACPGPHRYRQRGDALPPWCAACHYTPAGVDVLPHLATPRGRLIYGTA
jgi:uncharacterized membrane protein YccC